MKLFRVFIAFFTFVYLGCLNTDESSNYPAPIISFGDNSPDNEIVVLGRGIKVIKITFAAAGTIKSIKVDSNGIAVYKFSENNESVFNHEYPCVMRPVSLPFEYNWNFVVVDWNGKRTERKLKASFR